MRTSLQPSSLAAGLQVEGCTRNLVRYRVSDRAAGSNAAAA
jgi:hypothetical protein